MQEKKSLPFVIVLPSEIVTDKRLQPNARLHYGVLKGLSRDGICCASDQEMAEMWEMDIRQIQKWHSRLEECGYIRRVTNYIHTKRGNKSWISSQRKIHFEDY